MNKAACVAGLVAVVLHARAYAAIITHVTPLAGDTNSAVVDINDAGVMVGASFSLNFANVPTFHAFRWSGTGPVVAIPSPGGAQNAMYGVNNAGVAVGWTGSPATGFSHSPAGGSVILSGSAGHAQAINDNGLIVGEIIGATNHAYAHTGSGAPIDLGTLGGTVSSARAVNNSGVIVGLSTINATTTRRAFRYTTATGMQMIPGVPAAANAEAVGINDAGDIVGTSSATPGDSGQGWRWINGVTTPLALTQANDINDDGFIVGSAGGAAALVRPDGTVVNLDTWLNNNAPLAVSTQWFLTTANAINDSGQIVGYGNFNGAQQGFVLDASTLVPEPTAGLAVAAAALASLLPRRRRG